MCLTSGPLPKTNHEISHRDATELRSKVKRHSQMPWILDHFENARERLQKRCVEVTDHRKRMWIQNSVDRAIPTRLKMCDAKLAESASAMVQSLGRCWIALARSSTSENSKIRWRERARERMDDCMQSFSSSQSRQNQTSFSQRERETSPRKKTRLCLSNKPSIKITSSNLKKNGHDIRCAFSISLDTSCNTERLCNQIRSNEILHRTSPIIMVNEFSSRVDTTSMPT